MKGFAIGTVLEPECKKFDKGKEVVNFGLLVGKSSATHDVWKNEEGKGSNKVFDACSKLKNGDIVIVVFGSGLDKNGRLRDYINDIRLCPDALRKQLSAVFEDAKQ